MSATTTTAPAPGVERTSPRLLLGLLGAGVLSSVVCVALLLPHPHGLAALRARLPVLTLLPLALGALGLLCPRWPAGRPILDEEEAARLLTRLLRFPQQLGAASFALTATATAVTARAMGPAPGSAEGAGPFFEGIVPFIAGLASGVATFVVSRLALGPLGAAVLGRTMAAAPTGTLPNVRWPEQSSLAARVALSLGAGQLLVVAPVLAAGLLSPPMSWTRLTCLLLAAMGLAAGLLRSRERGGELGDAVQALARHLVQAARGADSTGSEMTSSVVAASEPRASAAVHLSPYVEVRRLLDAAGELTDCLARMHLAEYLAVERAREADRLKSQFLANMSHDLRSPLNAILGFAELLERGLDGPLGPEQLELVAAVRQRGNELLRLINQILDTAKLEAGRLELHREWIPAAECVARAVGEARKLAGRRPLEVRPALAAGLPPLQVDVVRIAQALAWLMVREGPPGQLHPVRITLSGRLVPGDPPYVEFEILDESEPYLPVSPALREALSQPRGPGMLVKALSDTGLSLPLARRLAEMHGGRLALGPPGGPPRFYLTLPAGAPARPAAATPERDTSVTPGPQKRGARRDVPERR